MPQHPRLLPTPGSAADRPVSWPMAATPADDGGLKDLSLSEYLGLPSGGREPAEAVGRRFGDSVFSPLDEELTPAAVQTPAAAVRRAARRNIFN